MTSEWTAAHVAGIDMAALPALPLIDAGVVPPVLPGRDLWDLWPLQHADGRVATVEGGELWFALSAPALGDPVERHGLARIRLLHFGDNVWRDLGDALPDGFSPGSREWSGSAIVEGDTVTLYFTAAGRRGEPGLTFEQRLFETRARIAGTTLTGWTPPVESVASDGIDYVVANQREGQVGTIKAFRDPGYFRDPADGAEYLLFAASLAASASAFNGAVGVAWRDEGRWTLRPPLVTADGLNNELERPHIVVHQGRHHLFWSTQASVFAPGVVAPTGLYGMVADRFEGPYAPLNGTGLVLANPSTAPAQAYSWLVLDDLRVVSFVDDRAIEGSARDRFGGIPAPVHQLTIDGDRAW